MHWTSIIYSSYLCRENLFYLSRNNNFYLSSIQNRHKTLCGRRAKLISRECKFEYHEAKLRISLKSAMRTKYSVFHFGWPQNELTEHNLNLLIEISSCCYYLYDNIWMRAQIVCGLEMTTTMPWHVQIEYSVAHKVSRTYGHRIQAFWQLIRTWYFPLPLHTGKDWEC